MKTLEEYALLSCLGNIEKNNGERQITNDLSFYQYRNGNEGNDNNNNNKEMKKIKILINVFAKWKNIIILNKRNKTKIIIMKPKQKIKKIYIVFIGKEINIPNYAFDKI